MATDRFAQAISVGKTEFVVVSFLKLLKSVLKYCNDPKFSDRYAWANSADPDQTAPGGAV